jgi:hypothetical protein
MYIQASCKGGVFVTENVQRSMRLCVLANMCIYLYIYVYIYIHIYIDIYRHKWYGECGNHSRDSVHMFGYTVGVYIQISECLSSC